MSQAHAVALPSRSRARWLSPLILVTESKIAAAIAAGGGGIYDDAPKRKGQQYDGAIGSLSEAERDAAFVRDQ